MYATDFVICNNKTKKKKCFTDFHLLATLNIVMKVVKYLIYFAIQELKLHFLFLLAMSYNKKVQDLNTHRCVISDYACYA